MNWEEQFDKQFEFGFEDKDGGFWLSNGKENFNLESVKSFISNLLAKAKEEGMSEKEKLHYDFKIRAAEKTRILGIIDGLKQEGKMEWDIGSEFTTPRDIRRTGWNQALEELKRKI